ncbi:MAG: hypothetical protein DRP47_02380 [Candidatus Zixiibacteriota bacterium]|nr:MAG: hypothetical protein DRP47_02380 [candidate division Zixibacteria bacterium]
MYDGKVRLTKRQIKEDKFATFVLSSRQQVMENWQFLVIGIVVIALIFVAVTYYFNSQEEAAARDADSYARAIMEYRSGNRQVALASLTQLIESTTDKSLLDKSIFALGNINFEIRNYTEALRYWEMYISRFKDNPLYLSAAYGGMAAVYENQAQFGDAATNYTEAVAAFPDGPLEGDYLFGAVRNYLLAGNVDQSKAQLDIIKEKYEKTDLYKRAARYFSENSQL